MSVLSESHRLAAVLSPIRRQLLQSLDTPDSASGIARRLGIPRQKVNYHLRELERAGFVEIDEQRQRRGCVERLVRLTARAFVVSPEFLEGLAGDPDRIQDTFSSSYLVSAASRIVRDVALLRERAGKVDQKLATMTLETEVSFESPAAFKAFSEELAAQLARLTTRYNNPRANSSRTFRIVLASHPKIAKTSEQADHEATDHQAKKRKSQTTRRRRKEKH
ncbi:MAG: helix-turn-helix domain-containing protein [Blastocatellia bacterium]